jgi:hypothetical protein
MTVPGGARDLRDGQTRAEFLISQLEQPVRLGLRRLLLISHSDCDKYGGSIAFPTAEEEIVRLREDLADAAGLIRDRFPEVSVVTFIAGVTSTGISDIRPVSD